MYREKSDRQIALQTRQNIDKYIDEDIDKVRPANTAENIGKYIDRIRTTKMSTKFALQTRCNYRQSSTKISFKFALQMQRYRQRTTV